MVFTKKQLKQVIKEVKYEEALANFLLKLKEREETHIKENFTNLTPGDFEVKYGRVYDKIVKIGTQEFVYAFIDKKTGAIIKPATWKSPEPKKRERGNIYNDDPLKGTNVYGVDYL